MKPKPTMPFKDIQNQRVVSTVVLMGSIFLIFFTPPIFSFPMGGIDFTSNVLGAILLLISGFYLLKTFEY